MLARLELIGIRFADLAEATGTPEPTPLDLLCHLAFQRPLRTRRERAEHLRRNRADFFDQYSAAACAILDTLLDQYTEHGPDEFQITHAVKHPTIAAHGNVMEIADRPLRRTPGHAAERQSTPSTPLHRRRSIMRNSRLLVTAAEIRDALTRAKPARIAVAYVGEEWSSYLPAGCLKELVVSPTLGSNPRAIEEIMKALKHQNVYFLDTLHAKIYLGEKVTVVGSCNLSDNGLGDSGRWEVAVLLEDAESLQKLEDTFSNYKKLAIEKYPDKKTKLSKLRKLHAQRSAAIRHGIIKGEKDETGEPPLLRDYKSDLDTIHICSFNGDFEYNKEALGAVIPEAVAAGPQSYFRDTLAHDEKYVIKEGDWLLCWPANIDGLPRINGRVSWLHAHHVVPNGAVHPDYTKLIGEAKPRWLTPVRPPFRLGPRTQQIIRDTLNLEKFKTLRDDEQRDAKRVNDFLEHVRCAQDEALRNQPQTERDF